MTYPPSRNTQETPNIAQNSTVLSMNSDSDLSTIFSETFESFQCKISSKCAHSHLKAEINDIFL